MTDTLNNAFIVHYRTRRAAGVRRASAAGHRQHVPARRADRAALPR
jgi:hypothetical protein